MGFEATWLIKIVNLQMKAIIIGGSGFTGRKLLAKLLSDDSYSKIYALVRNRLDIENPKLNQLIVDFEEYSQNDLPKGLDVAFCCLGSTIKKAKSKANFRKIDFGFITKFAQMCSNIGVKRFHLISSVGADAESMFNYQKVKGEIEDYVSALEFDSLYMYRPSVIYGGRKEFRPFEAFSAWISRNFSFLFFGKMRRILGITGDQLTNTIYSKSKLSIKGIFIIESEEIYLSK